MSRPVLADPASLSATEAAEAIREGRLSSEILVRACLDRIARREPEVHAWAHLDPDYALEVYVDGQQVTVPAGVGIVQKGLSSCLYALHVHDGEPNLIHIESPVQKTYTVGELFDIWGQELTDTSFMGHPIDAQHKLTIEVYDESGKLVQTYTGKPRDLAFNNRQTFVYKYNSPDVKPALFDWSKF